MTTIPTSLLIHHSVRLLRWAQRNNIPPDLKANLQDAIVATLNDLPPLPRNNEGLHLVNHGILATPLPGCQKEYQLLSNDNVE